MRWMKRGDEERGATAVVVALMLVVLFGFGALAVDAGALWWDRKELQNGADAAALAVAQTCATKSGCDSATERDAMAAEYARGNKYDSNVLVEEVVPDETAGTVRVRLTSEREHWLAPILSPGAESTNVRASAIASWGGIGAATVLPLTISMCADAAYAVGTEIEVVIRDKKTEEEICFGSVGHYSAGNWGWLNPNNTTDCVTDTETGVWAPGDPGVSIPTGCETKLRGLELEDSVLLPVFEGIVGTGAGTRFEIVGFISLKVSSYCLAHNKPGLSANVDSPSTPECKTANDQWIRGTFIEFVELGAELGGPNLGSTTVRLTE